MIKKCFRLPSLFCFSFTLLLIADISTGAPLLNRHGIPTTNPFVVDRFFHDGQEIDMVVVPGLPEPPIGFHRSPVAITALSTRAAALSVLSNVPAMTWVFGCSATSAAMLFGYYDNTGFHDMYTGRTNGGVFPMTNADWGTVNINGENRALCPLSATREGLDGRDNKGHVDDYWYEYFSDNPDPFIGAWPEHEHGDCTADYMGTNQSEVQNLDGATTFFLYPSGAPLQDYTYSEPGRRDGCHGMRLFAESRGYRVVTNYTQYILGYDGKTQGFTYDDFKREIDAGRPVLIHVEGHTMLGFGYDDNSSSVFIHDTWDYNDYTMPWGGDYSGMSHYAVTVIQIVTTPTVNTADVASIGTDGAECGGEAIFDGGAVITARGVCWGDSPNPMTAGNKTVDGDGVGEFTSTLTGLTPGETYYVRAYAVNSEGTSYGDNVSFTTYASSPDIYASESDPVCGGYDPCYQSIANAFGDAAAGITIWAQGEIFSEHVALDRDVEIEIVGGQDFSQSGALPETQFDSLTIKNGAITVSNISLSSSPIPGQ